VTVWDDLKVVLEELRQTAPCPLQGHPDPKVDWGRQPPFAIHLQPWAVDVAHRLHSRFGDGVSLTVGALGYPEGEPPLEDRRQEESGPGIEVDLAQPVVVSSGHTVRTTLRVTNREAHELVLHTNGQLVARVLDPETRTIVGGFSGAMTLPLVRFPIPPGGTADVPLLVGTASLVRALGYSLPPGEWVMDTVLTVADGRRIRTSAVALTITP